MLCQSVVSYGQPAPSAPGTDVFTAWGPSSVLYIRNQPGGCTDDQYVLQTTAEAGVQSPFSMDAAAAGQIGVAILLAWAAAWCIRQLAAVIRGGSSDSHAADD